jgi:hypothetical protein
MMTAPLISPANNAINQQSLDGETPLFKTNNKGMPVFLGKTYEDHVEAFQGIDRSVDARLWALAAVAASLKTKYNEQTIQKFAHEVRHSAVYIYELAATYKKFENSTRVEILSFTHHRIAARAKDPQKAICAANDEEMSTRELEKWIKRQEPPTRRAVKEIDTLHEPEVRKHLEETVRLLKDRDEAVPGEAPFLHNMYHAMIGQVQWQLDRSIEEDCERVFEAIEEGNYPKDDILNWLQARGYFMREHELDDRLAHMAQKGTIRETKQGGKKDQQRGDMITIFVPAYSRDSSSF